MFSKKFSLRSLYESYFLIPILLVALLPLAIVTFLTYGIAQTILRDQAIDKLRKLADNKESFINRYIFNKQAEVNLLAHTPLVVNFAAFNNQTNSSEQTRNQQQILTEQLQSFIPYFLEFAGYKTVYILNDQNQIIFTSSHDPAQNNSDLDTSNPLFHQVIDHAKTLMELDMSNFVYLPGESRPAAFMASPLIQDGSVVGTLVVKMSNEEIDKIVSDNSDIGKTGETIVGFLTKEGNIELTAPLEFENGKMPVGNEVEKHLEQAASGQEGSGMFTDYRGQDVLAAWRYLPPLRWGMIVKLDSNVALAPVLELRERIIFLGGISLLLVGLIANFVSKRLQQAESFLTNIINSISSSLVIVNQNLKVVRWNQNAEKTLQVKPDQIQNKPITELFPYLVPHADKINQAIQDKSIQSVERIDLTKKDKKEYAEVFIYPLSQQNFQGAVLRIDDITERVNLVGSIIQSDKLASIGVLTAGIAHEINNPINFVSSSIPPLRHDIEDLLQVFNKYSALEPNSDLNTSLEQINTLKEELELDYTIKEIPKLLDGIKEGAERTAVIVKDLRTFSRLDETEMKETNLQEGIDSTLTLLKNKYKNRIEIVKEYGNVPPIDGYPGKLNQVFMNILSNAIDAIKEKGEITIKTYQVDDSHVAVSIKDSGIGMSDTVKAKIFEPFFTTKPVGSGTGLGLAITYGIIQEHHGLIDVRSEPGKGTEFIITFPITQTNT